MRSAFFAALTATLCLPSMALASGAPPQCPMVLDFDFDAAGQAILAGQDVSEAYSAWGIDLIAWTAMSMQPADIGLAVVHLLSHGPDGPTGQSYLFGTTGTPREESLKQIAELAPS